MTSAKVCIPIGYSMAKIEVLYEITKYQLHFFQKNNHLLEYNNFINTPHPLKKAMMMITIYS